MATDSDVREPYSDSDIRTDRSRKICYAIDLAGTDADCPFCGTCFEGSIMDYLGESLSASKGLGPIGIVLAAVASDSYRLGTPDTNPFFVVAVVGGSIIFLLDYLRHFLEDPVSRFTNVRYQGGVRFVCKSCGNDVLIHDPEVNWSVFAFAFALLIPLTVLAYVLLVGP